MEKNILHKLNKKKAERLLRNTININRAPFIFRIIHGFNNGTGKVELIKKNIIVTEDNYIEFEIDYCSTYILTAKAIEDDTVAPSNLSDVAKSPNTVDTMPIALLFVAIAFAGMFVILRKREL